MPVLLAFLKRLEIGRGEYNQAVALGNIRTLHASALGGLTHC